MNQELMERYIYAVTRRLPGSQREDVSRELRGLIEDMLVERCGDRPVEEKDVRVVLTELGSPQELSAKYDGDGDQCLIGQPYYNTYKNAMKLMLAAIVGGLTVANLILQLVEPRGVIEWTLSWLACLWDGCLSAFAIVTVVFAWLYHKNIPVGQPFNFDDLPPVPKKTEAVSKWECYAGIGFGVVFTAVFLLVPQVFHIPALVMGEWIPVLDGEAVRKSWYIIVLFAGCGVFREVVKLLEGRYNKRVLAATAGANLVSAVLATRWLMGSELMNPRFQEKIGVIFAGDGEFVVRIFSNFQYFFLGCILLALVLDTAETVFRTQNWE